MKNFRPRPLSRQVGLLMVGLLAFACTAEDPPGPTGPNTVPSGPASRSVVGCFSAGAASSSVGCGILPTFGDSSADAAMSAEVAYQYGFWFGAPAQVYVFDECGSNRNAMSFWPEARILFGRNLFNGLNPRANGLPVFGVLAHEWAHQLQFRNGWQTTPVRNSELEADAFAGFYLGLAKGWAWNLINGFFQAIFDIGDYDFNSPGHHGTPNQRLAAARLGFDTGAFSLINRRPFTWIELHQLFSSRIASLGRSATGPSRVGASLEDAWLALEASEADAIARGEGVGSNRTVPFESETARRALWPRP
jgi:hypothetical protein